ncbi:MAG: hypothetical protein H7A46_05940 [Verrucomicrobiales bacterium]|nr:hypothetical protein [Verrucomicrobiales bacterium]
MTTPEGQVPGHWNIRRWSLVGVLILTIQVSLVVTLSWRPGEILPPVSRQSSLRFVTDPALDQRLHNLEWMPDPARFATPGRKGFTASLWRPSPLPDLPWLPRPEPPRYLEHPFDGDTGLTDLTLESPRRLPRVVADPAPVLDLPPIEGPPLPSHSWLKVEGDLAGRPVVVVESLPVWPLEDVLPPSVVQVVVGPEGSVLSATPHPPGSGLPAADTQAMELARSIRFEALPAGQSGLMWGRLVFRWATVPPPTPANTATNPPPGP